MQINATKITKMILSATLKVIVSMLPTGFLEKSAFTKQNPGTQKSILKPAIHLTITKGKLAGDISNMETIDTALDNSTPRNHTNEFSETRCLGFMFFFSNEPNLNIAITL